MIPLSLLANNIPRTSFLRPENEALTYAAAVETADTEQLEFGTKSAYNNLFRELKRQGNFQQMNVGCLLSGARTLDGSLIPFKGDSPGNFGFVSADYNRKTGLISDTTKYLTHLTLFTYGSLDNIHMLAWLSAGLQTGSERYLGGVSGQSSIFGAVTAGFRARMQSNTVNTLGTGTTQNTLIGASRGNTAEFNWIGLGQSGTQTRVSDGTPLGGASEFTIFAQPTGTFPSNNLRLAFYSAGNHVSGLDDIQTAIQAYIDQLNEWIP